MSQRKGIDGPAGFEAGLVKTTAELKKAIRDTDKSAIELDKRYNCPSSRQLLTYLKIHGETNI